MHTFSRLQRNSDDEKTFLKNILVFVALFLYETLSTIYPYLPPLFGLAGWRIATSRDLGEKILWSVYLYIYETDHGLVCCNLLLAALGGIFFYRRLRHFIGCYNCLKILLTLFFYLIAAILLIFLSYIFNAQINPDMTLIVYYLILDMVVVLYAK